MVDLRLDVTALFLAVLDGDVHQLGVLLLLGSGQDEGRIGGGILGLIFANGWITKSALPCNHCTLRIQR